MLSYLIIIGEFCVIQHFLCHISYVFSFNSLSKVELHSTARSGVPEPTRSCERYVILHCFMSLFSESLPSNSCMFKSENYRFCGKLIATIVLEFTKTIWTAGG